MLDAELRELERAVSANPHDRRLSERLLQALLRAGRIAPESADLEPRPNPGLSVGDLVLVVRRARPRASFAWLPEMDAAIGEAARIARLHRDGLGALLEGGKGELAVGRSFGFASLYGLSV